MSLRGAFNKIKSEYALGMHTIKTAAIKNGARRPMKDFIIVQERANCDRITQPNIAAQKNITTESE